MKSIMPFHLALLALQTTKLNSLVWSKKQKTTKTTKAEFGCSKSCQGKGSVTTGHMVIINYKGAAYDSSLVQYLNTRSRFVFYASKSNN